MVDEKTLKRLEARSRKHMAWKKFRDEDCYNTYELSHTFGVSIPTVRAIGNDRIRVCRKLSDDDFKLVQKMYRRYIVADRAVKWYAPHRSATVLGVHKGTAYRVFWKNLSLN